MAKAYTLSRYGLLNPEAVKGQIREEPVAATQYFHPAGTHFVYFDSNGRITLALTATGYLYGWAFSPISLVAGSTDAANGYWTSSSTAGADKLNVCFGITAVYRGYSATMAQARIGECADLVGVNDGTRQYVNPGTSTQDVLVVRGLPLDGDTAAAIVSINPNEFQKDT